VRNCDPADAEIVVDILVGAFHEDPTWSRVFPDEASRRQLLRALWGMFVDGALRYRTVWLNDSATAAAVWIPPGGTELSEEQEEALVPNLTALGLDTELLLGIFEAFEVSHPRAEPHWYLSLLGTRADMRGHGYGLGLLAETLQLVDAAGAPAYLEASNPANVPLYQRYGFEPAGSFTLPRGGPTVTTMWRAASA
jgi:GNAT superfamily N-acetyltransferase